MFVGAIPRTVVAQALSVVDLKGVSDVFVCCSGSFRLEQALAQRYPEARVHSNDVALLSCALGQLAVGSPLEFKFTDRLQFLECALQGKEPIDRLAALGVAVKLGGFLGKSEHAKAHFAHYETEAESYIALGRKKLEDYVSKLRLASFTACDFRLHARAAIERDALIAAWPPTYKSGYESLYKLINRNTSWSEPHYEVFDPDNLGDWLSELDQAKARYMVWADHELVGRKATAIYAPGRARRIYLYTSIGQSGSFRRDVVASEPFKYRVADPWQFTPTSKVEVRLADRRTMNFLKDRYLAPGLAHSDGQLRCVVYVDGAIAGGWIYTQDSMRAMQSIYLLSDFATSRERKLSKLIAMLATGEETVRHWDAKKFTKVLTLTTSAFTKKSVSMKYRGIWNLIARKSEFLQYQSEVRRVSNEEIYRDWWKRYAKSAVRGSAGSADG